jgi:uncharacterized protein
MRSWLPASVAAIVLVAAPVCAAALQSLSVVSEKGAFTYNVELANDDATREKGLMFRKEMPKDHGMLFDFGKNQVAYMWMKNTFIPLDMVFIRADGEVASIAKNAQPQSLAIISSGVRVRAVLELNAGEADAIGVKPGDHVKHKMFKAKTAG